MAARKVIIDCDPGQDDAVALFLAFASRDELDLLGVTTVAGNVPLELTQRNARMMCDIAGAMDVRVFAGCNRPLRVELETAEYIHGKTGIDGVDVFEPDTPLAEGHAVSFHRRHAAGGRRRIRYARADGAADQHRNRTRARAGDRRADRADRTDGRRHARERQSFAVGRVQHACRSARGRHRVSLRPAPSWPWGST